MRFIRSIPLQWLFYTVVGGLLVWILFFDSHSILNRVQWHQEYQELSSENEELREEIDELETRLEEPLSDDVIEQLAREDYGMSRPGETIYRIEEE